MSIYLSPRNDVTFKHVFAKNKHLCMALLNAFLPIEEAGMGKVEQVESIERLPSELIPDMKGVPYSVIDLRCTDSHGRQFIVEMQLRWESSFDQRILRNAALAYGEQKLEDREFDTLRPIYALSFLFDSLDPNAARSPEKTQALAAIFGEHPDKIYYRYLLSEVEFPDLRIKGLEMIFVDMKKFVRAADRATLRGLTELRSLWLDLLTGVDETTQEPPVALTQNPYTAEALKCLERAAYDTMERLLYRKIEDAKCIAVTAFRGSHREGVAEGLARAAVEIEAERARANEATARATEADTRAAEATARAAAEIEAERTRAKQEKLETARNLKAMHLDVSAIARATGLSVAEIEKL
ncbi:MAG: Rpn family recombination-promoting nuclease/putative transposase [Puniceicoccales bacterium]|jgi:predicted transposase/invertase (TIGR01784 family)|nr:Rpn family recombination-promoting nuclease/putative transposase [Puniceicoccales bacterium]